MRKLPTAEETKAHNLPLSQVFNKTKLFAQLKSAGYSRNTKRRNYKMREQFGNHSRNKMRNNGR